MRNLKRFENFSNDQDLDDDDMLTPIGADNSVAGINGLVFIFSPLESDMIEDWNSDNNIRKFIKGERIFLKNISYDSWQIWGVDGDREVQKYIMKNYSW
jgi:hypothetical protein